MNLGLPSWQSLIDEIAKRLNYDPSVFSQYGNYLELAEYLQIEEGRLGDVRSWMDRKWHENEDRVDASRIHQLIVDLDFHTIYTTNYDRWIEIAHERRGKARHVVANVRDMARHATGRAQIVKFHGDFGDDKSLVLTESGYFERMSLDSPMDLKLRVDALGKSLLFVGYRLGDINIRYLLYNIWMLWRSTEFDEMRPKSYIFMAGPNPVQEAIFKRRGIVPLVSEHDDPGLGLETLLTEIASGA